jgi:caffeoyl-CoA O-methyltransferase
LGVSESFGRSTQAPPDPDRRSHLRSAPMADAPKSFFLSPEIHEYLVAHGTPPDAVQLALIGETAKLGGISRMQIAPEQGAFMTLLTRLVGAKSAVEVGTFTGYSALCIARGLPADGHLLCCDVSEEWTSVGRPYWEQAGVADRIELRIAPAVETLRALPREETIDLAFVDADKGNYPAYYEELLARLRPNGVILIDNVLWGGSVVEDDPKDENRVAIRAFNDAVAQDERVDTVMLPLGDGLTLLRKR